jgi:hypothetical protein
LGSSPGVCLGHHWHLGLEKGWRYRLPGPIPYGLGGSPSHYPRPESKQPWLEPMQRPRMAAGDWLARHRIADMLQWAHHDRPSGCWLAPVTTTTRTTPAGPGTGNRRSSLQSAHPCPSCPKRYLSLPPQSQKNPPRSTWPALTGHGAGSGIQVTGSARVRPFHHSHCPC